MKILNLLYIKFALSFLICVFTSFVIFFIFSLIGNLNEGYLFNIIIKLSLLNSIQIITYVPTFIFLISVILLTIFLRSNNEVIIIKSYLNLKKLFIFFLPIVMIFTAFEINKKYFSSYIDLNKENLLNQNNLSNNKIMINDYQDIKEITVLQNFDLNNLNKAEYRKYKIFGKTLNLAEYSNSIVFLNNELIINNFTQYKDNVIKDLNIQKKIKIDQREINKNNSFIKNNKNLYEINLKKINITIFFTLFLNCIFLSFFNKKFASSKQSLVLPVSMSIIILLYSLIIFNNTLILYRQEFELLASIVIGMFFLKVYLNE